jgi:hypothetical protein
VYARDEETGGSGASVEAQASAGNQCRLIERDDKNHFSLWRELGELMTKDCTVPHNKSMLNDAKLVGCAGITSAHQPERSHPWANPTRWRLSSALQRTATSRVIAQGARYGRTRSSATTGLSGAMTKVDEGSQKQLCARCGQANLRSSLWMRH